MNGAQAERTSLAWTRSLAPAICLLAYALRTVSHQASLVALAGGVALTTWTLQTRRRTRYLRDVATLADTGRPTHPSRTAAVAAAVALTGVALGWTMMTP